LAPQVPPDFVEAFIGMLMTNILAHSQDEKVLAWIHHKFNNQIIQEARQSSTNAIAILSTYYCVLVSEANLEELAKLTLTHINIQDFQLFLTRRLEHPSLSQTTFIQFLIQALEGTDLFNTVTEHPLFIPIVTNALINNPDDTEFHVWARKHFIHEIVEFAKDNPGNAMLLLSTCFHKFLDLRPEYLVDIVEKHAQNTDFLVFMIQKNEAIFKPHRTFVDSLIATLFEDDSRRLIAIPTIAATIKSDLFKTHKNAVLELMKTHYGLLNTAITEHSKKDKFSAFFATLIPTIAIEKMTTIKAYQTELKGADNLTQLTHIIQMITNNTVLNKNHYTLLASNHLILDLNKILAIIHKPEISISNKQLTLSLAKH
jgi:hypothetical protein